MSSILFLSQSLPFPPDSGGKQRTFHVLTQLQEGFDVHLVAFSRRGHQPDEGARRKAEADLSRRLTRVLPSVPVPGEWSRLRRLRDHGSSLLTGHVYSYFQYGVPEFGRRLKEALETAEPDLVHLDGIDLAPWFDRLSSLPVTCTHHDVESHLLRRRSGTRANPLVRAHIAHQARLMQRMEQELCPRFALNLTMSEVDTGRLREIAPTARIEEAPNAVDLERFHLPPEEREEEDTVVFVGPTYLFANRDAADFLLGEIWPRVRRRRPAARLLMIGKNAPGEAEAFAEVAGVTPLGRVESIQPHMARAGCSVIPIRVGGGTRIKILESWALGRAVVTTSLGGEGLAVEEGSNALVRDDPEAFAEAIVRVLEERELRRRLGREGRETVQRLYTWKAVGAKLRERYREIIAVRPTPHLSSP